MSSHNRLGKEMVKGLEAFKKTEIILSSFEIDKFEKKLPIVMEKKLNFLLER